MKSYKQHRTQIKIRARQACEKKTKIFQQKNYLENFIQCIFDTCDPSELKGSTILVSGDGRYYNDVAIQVICQIAAANEVKRVWIGKGGLCSTPAASAIIRERENNVALGGVLLTASHNPGGIDNDFGVKFNSRNGGPAVESFTKQIFEKSKTIKTYKTVQLKKIDLNTIGIQTFDDIPFTVEIIDPVEEWMRVMKRCFDFDIIKKLLSRNDFKMLYDGMFGVAGPYAKSLFIDEFKLGNDSLMRCEPKPDFGGCHPDPNLTYGKELVDILKVHSCEVDTDTPNFGAAGDGDCDRNMILGRNFFVSPSDSVAIIAYYAQICIPYFKQGLKGVSRSMPTSCALDRVAKKLNISLHEVPTGWKFFGNLMDGNMLSICGEESFGTGSDHIREKDGLWAVLAWLSIIAHETEFMCMCLGRKMAKLLKSEK